MTEVVGSADSIIVTGDFNAHLEKKNISTASFRSSFMENGLHLVDTPSTYFRVDPPSWLDLFLVDDLSKVSKFQSSGQSFISRYDYGCLSFNLPGVTDICSFQFRDYKALKPYPFQCDIIESLRQAGDLLSRDGIDASVKFFNLSLAAVAEKHLPLKTYTSRRPPKSYISDEIKALMRHRDKLYGRFLRTRDPQLLHQYRLIKSQVLKKKRKAKSEHYKTIFHDISDGKQLWNTLTKLGFTKAKQMSALVHFQENELADYYTWLQTKHPACALSDVQQVLNSHPVDISKAVFHFREVTEDEVSKALKKTCNKSRGSSPNGVYIRYFQQFLHLFVPFCTVLFNKCFTDSVYPEAWKISKIVPLCK